jgi:hypothetical protein
MVAAIAEVEMRSSILKIRSILEPACEGFRLNLTEVDSRSQLGNLDLIPSHRDSQRPTRARTLCSPSPLGSTANLLPRYWLQLRCARREFAFKQLVRQ